MNSSFLPALLFFSSILTLVTDPVAFASSEYHPDFIPSDPISEFLTPPDGGPTLDFCSKWNPEFSFRGHVCCPKTSIFPPPARRGRSRRRVKNLNRCEPRRAKASYCDEMTPEQKQYSLDAPTGKLGDLLKLITLEMGKKGQQSYCTVNNGFMAHARRVIPTSENRVLLRSPGRCVDFGTDGMVGMIEWLGQEINRSYQGPEFDRLSLLVGDVSAPRGGCLSGRAGRRGHASHTAGLDADIGFFNPFPNRATEQNFTRVFVPNTNWWFIKKIFANPFACVKVIFLDRKLIAKLSRHAGSDPDWAKYRKFIRHVRHHANHYHVRLGTHPGPPGCVANPKPELESIDEQEAQEFMDSSEGLSDGQSDSSNGQSTSNDESGDSRPAEE